MGGIKALKNSTEPLLEIKRLGDRIKRDFHKALTLLQGSLSYISYLHFGLDFLEIQM